MVSKSATLVFLEAATKKKLKIEAAETGKKIYEIVEEAVKLYFKKRENVKNSQDGSSLSDLDEIKYPKNETLKFTKKEGDYRRTPLASPASRQKFFGFSGSNRLASSSSSLFRGHIRGGF